MSGARGGGVGWGLSGPVPSKRAAGRVRRDGAQPIGEMRARAAWSRQSPPHPAPAGSTVDTRMIHRECGVLKTTYEADMGLYPLPIARWTVAALAVLFLLVLPFSVHEYYLSIVILVAIAVVGALVPNLLVRYTGQISIGHG